MRAGFERFEEGGAKVRSVAITYLPRHLRRLLLDEGFDARAEILAAIGLAHQIVAIRQTGMHQAPDRSPSSRAW